MVVSVGLLLVAMAVVGLTFRNGEYNIEMAERMTRGQMMTERLLAAMEARVLTTKEREQSGWVGEDGMPGMSWRVEVSPHEQIRGLIDVDISIYMGDPDNEKERQLVLWTRVLRPEDSDDFDGVKACGLDDDQQAALSSAGVDPSKLPTSIRNWPPDQLVEKLMALAQALGPNFRTGNPQLDAILQQVQQGDISQLQTMIEQLLGQAGGKGGISQGGGETSGQGSKAGQGSPSGGSQSGTGQPGGGGTRRGLRDRAGGGKQ